MFTLGRAMTLFTLLLALVVGVVFYTWWTRSKEEATARAAEDRKRAIDSGVSNAGAFLQQGDDMLRKVAAEFTAGRCEGVSGAESCLLSVMAQGADFSEATYITEGNGAPWQLTVFRLGSKLCTRHISWADRKSRTECRDSTQLLAACKPEGIPEELGDDSNPVDSYGYSTPFEQQGRVLRSDISRSQFDESVRRMLFLYGLPSGVLKVGLFADHLGDFVRRVKVSTDERFYVFLCDWFVQDPNALDPKLPDEPQGRLIAGLRSEDRLTEYEDNFRIDPSSLPPQVTAALRHTALGQVKDDHPTAEARFDIDTTAFTANFRRLPRTPDPGWTIGVVGPDEVFFGEVHRIERLFQVFIGIGLFAMLGAILVARIMQRALNRVEAETNRMSNFDFTPSVPKTPFADVRDALLNVERAKTAMRALGRFVPVALVRQLFLQNQEPELSSQPRELSMMFTDIEGFTTLVEREEPLVLAKWLGDYFAAMTRGVHAEGGIVDKFIGDAVMALWNAPNDLEQHPVRACAAALRCLTETEALYASEQWKGRPKLVTRFGLHTSTVLVGHFGAPDRISYTAIGDGVNLASRLEGLNKQFGTRIIVSEAVEERARDTFVFRKLDKVAVKGKSKAIAVFELVGIRGATCAAKEPYERALAAYAGRDFARACELLSGHVESDAPSRLLHERCKQLIASPPPPDWDGTLHAEK